MSPWLTPEVIVSIATLLTAIIGFITIMVQNNRQHALTNSRMSELLVITKVAAVAEGKLEGIAEAEKKPKELTGEIVGEVTTKGEPPKDITGDIKGELLPVTIKVVEKAPATSKKKR